MTIGIHEAKELYKTANITWAIQTLDAAIEKALIKRETHVQLDLQAFGDSIQSEDWDNVLAHAVEHYRNAGYTVDVVKGKYIHRTNIYTGRTSGGAIATFTISGWA